MKQAYCGIVSAEAGESLGGTAASSTWAWIGLEVRGLWAPAAIDSPSLDGTPAAAIRSWLDAVPGSRFQLIRRPRETRELRLILANTKPGAHWAIELTGDSIETLCSIDVAATFERGGHPDGTALERSVWICTHGKRDRCCSLFGTDVFVEAAKIASDEVWQTSHLGGHRFAATAVSLPSGICVGRLRSDEVAAWLEADAHHQLHDLERARGRTAYEPAAQAAELYLWQQSGTRDVEAFALQSSDKRGDDTWLLRFRDAKEGAEYVVEAIREVTGVRVLGSCGDSEDRAAIRWRCSTQ